ncbi:xanthine dehydrogenase family protein molybdopterin-binding subunit [Chloroflexota bacterium]
MAELSVVGKSIIKVDAFGKVTGKTKYASDEGIGIPGMLYGKVLFSPYAHARILNVDTSKASQMKGVRAVLTGKDTPDNRTGSLIEDRHILCHETVRFAGDAVAVVAADTIEAAEEASGLIKVEYKELPAIFDVEDAMKPDCPVLVHPDLANYNRPLYKYMGDDLPGPNVHTHHKIRKGDVEEGFQEADLIVENRFQNDRMSHCQLEPFNSACYPESDGSLTLWTSARLFGTQREICQAFNLPFSQLRVRTGYLGGMFGMVGRTERFAVLIALKTGKPVKMVYTREENFLDGLTRLPDVIYIKDGVKKDGTLVAREAKVIINTGAYGDMAPLTIRNCAFHATQYRLPNYKWDAYGVYTNEPCSGPLRGFGNSEALCATESQMDIVCEKLGMDPVEFRMKNTVDEGEQDVRGQIVHCIGAKECLGKVAEWIEWGKPGKPASGNIRIGKGIAMGNKYTQIDTASAAMVRVNMDGIIEAFHGGDDCGQGLNTVITQITAEEFGVTVEKIKVVWGDTARVPYDFGTASSRSTLFMGNAIRLACQDAKRQIFDLAAPKLDTASDNLETRDGMVFVKDSPEKQIKIAGLFLPAKSEARGVVKTARCLAEGGEIIGKATFWGQPSAEDQETGQGERLSMSVAYGAQGVEVAVDMETGLVKVLRLCSAFDTGKTINPKACEGQIEGGAAMGIGSALYEAFMFNDKGELLNPNFHDYRLCGLNQVPSGDNMKSMTVEHPHREGPYGAKGVAEAGMCPTAPAIASAIYNATGARLKHIPMTPERVLDAIEKAKRV